MEGSDEDTERNEGDYERDTTVFRVIQVGISGRGNVCAHGEMERK